MSQRDERIPELDGLRGIAIVGVILFHLGLRIRLPETLAALSRYGWTGVDLFFVLSGFLIGGILIDQRTSDEYYAPFYARRFFRIVPLYLAIVGVYGLVSLSSARTWLVDYFLPSMPWYTYLTFTNNIWIAVHDSMAVFIAPSWSLAIEEQFYLTLPIIVRFVPARRLLPTVCTLAGTIVVIRACSVYFGNFTQNQIYTLPCFREDALLVGVICALLIRNSACRLFLARNGWILLVGIAVSASFLLFIDGFL